MTEESPLNPLSLYAITKHEAERIVDDVGGTSFRLGTLFGLGDNFSRIRLDLVLNLPQAESSRIGHANLRTRL